MMTTTAMIQPSRYSLVKQGTVYCPASKASVSGDTVSFGGTCSVSGSTVTLA